MKKRVFNKKYAPPGSSPGLTTGTHEPPAGAPRIRLISYNTDSFFEQDLASVEQCRSHLDQDLPTWIHVQGEVSSDILRSLGSTFGLHTLALEDIMHTGQRPKVDFYDDHVFVVAAHPVANGGDSNAHSFVQVGLFLGNDWVISFHSGADDPFDPVRQRLRSGGSTGRIRTRTIDYLFYALLDVAVDLSFPLMEQLGERIETLEEQLLAQPTRQTLHEIHNIKRELLLFRRHLWPLRDVMNQLIREETPFITDAIKWYLRDCYDHTVQIMELLESYRELTSSMIDIYMSSQSFRLNDVLRVLTMISTLFIPLTFITSVYGMNFGNNQHSFWAMPELRWAYGYPMVWGIIIAVAIAMLMFFKRKDWL